MLCEWNSFLRIIPIWMREIVDKLGKATLQELRLRVGKQLELVCSDGCKYIDKIVSSKDIDFCINAASGYSPWSAATSAEGYITGPGGHRIGIAGDTVVIDGIVTGIRSPTMLCIRIARDFKDISTDIPIKDSSILIIGRPGCGKTTLLRDVIRRYSNSEQGSIAVIDERNEIFPLQLKKYCFDIGNKTDVLSGCKKKQGIDMLLRSMSPSVIAVDEITCADDCNTMLHAAWCGIRLFATAHAGSLKDLLSRPVYKPIIESGIFDTLVTVYPNKTHNIERINI